MERSRQLTTSKRHYGLVTAAYNEEALIGRLIESVVSQVLRPQKWIIVSDGSTDHTDAIVRDYATRYPFLELLRVTENHPRNFSAQANAINIGFNQLRDSNCEYIGNIDADVSFEADYFERLIVHFEQDQRLGLAGGSICEEYQGEFKPRRYNSVNSVANAVQLFRRGCLDTLGGKYCVLPYGGHDWHAEVMARMRGWGVQTFPELRVFHHRPTGAGAGLNRHAFRQGMMDFTLGVDPLFEVGKLLRRIYFHPISSVFRLAGYCLACCRNEKRVVSPEFVEFLRSEQRQRTRSWHLIVWKALKN